MTTSEDWEPVAGELYRLATDIASEDWEPVAGELYRLATDIASWHGAPKGLTAGELLLYMGTPSPPSLTGKAIFEYYVFSLKKEVSIYNSEVDQHGSTST